MTRKRNGHKPALVHGSLLQRSDPDTIALGMAVEERFIQLCADYIRIRGVALVPPESLAHDLLHWRTMRVRHRRGDNRHNAGELRATKAVAQWTLDVKRVLCNQQPETIEWAH